MSDTIITQYQLLCPLFINIIGKEEREMKHTSFRHFINHSSHSSLWKTCPHGKIRTISPFSNASIQIAHSSLEKYRLVGRLCFLLSRLGPALVVEDGSGEWARSVGEKDALFSVKDGRSGGEEMIEGWMGGGG